MPNSRVGVDTTYMRGDAFKEFRDQAEAIEKTVATEAPTEKDIVPNPESQLDEYVQQLVRSALEMINGVADALPKLTDSDGRNVGYFAKLATMAEESGTQGAHDAASGFNGVH
ncbi:hypothetical protein [Micromonospora marina]|uniref:hypothetical protein n=1 Tax=Micromonospora marina TaxID=307120 RepID=UPI00345657C0